MRPLFIIAIAMGLEACSSCTPAPGPIDAAPPIRPDQTSVIYSELVEGGCLQPDDSGDGFAAIYELSVSDQEPAWLSCLYATTLSPTACGAPCGSD